MVLGEAVSKLEKFVWTLNNVSKSVHVTSYLLTLKASSYGQITILNVIILCGCQFIDWLKFETHPSSLHYFGMVYYIYQTNHV